MTVLPSHADIIVVGGGPIGTLAALRFAQSGYRVIVVEKREQADRVQDTRALALSWNSYQHFCHVGAWPDTPLVTAIDAVHVSQQGAWGRTLIHHDDLALPHLGWVIDYSVLAHSLAQQVEKLGIAMVWSGRVSAVRSLSGYATVTVDTPQGCAVMTCRLVVLADGGALLGGLPSVRQYVYDYQQCAIVTRVTPEWPHQHVAYERFSEQGPLALLPYGRDFVVVWTRTTEEARQWQMADQAVQLRQLQAALGERHGQFAAVATPSVFPLVLKYANRVVCPRTVLIGNAAQVVHPIAAQGLNLGVRDATTLADQIAGALDPGAAPLLARYQAARYRDSRATMGFTHGLIQLAGAQAAAFKPLRGIGMTVLDTIPILRKTFARHLVWGYSR